MDQELKAYLDLQLQQLQQFRQETAAFRQETAEQFAKIDQRLERLDQRQDRMDQRQDRLETDVRRAYVVIESLDGKVRLVAEGVTNVAEQLKRHDEKVSRELEEIRTFNRLSYEDLDTRVRKLEAAKQ